METMAEYLAELVKAGLEDRKAASLPEGVSVREIVKISEENHMDYLLLGALLKTDGLSEDEKELLREKVLGSMLFTGMQLQELKKLERMDIDRMHWMIHRMENRLFLLYVYLITLFSMHCLLSSNEWNRKAPS